MKSLLAALRDSSSPALWSEGVELSRACDIQVIHRSPQEISLRLSAPKLVVARQISLWLEDEDWNCDCKSAVDPCTHVIAAAILCNQPERLAAVQAKSQVGLIRYEWAEQNGSLALRRQVVVGDQILPLRGTMAQLAQNTVPGLPRVVVTKEDITIETLILRESFSVWPGWFILKLFPTISKSGRSYWGDQPVMLSTTPCGLAWHVEDQGGSVRLYAKEEQGITHKFSNGFVLMGQSIHPYNGANLDKTERDLLAGESIYGAKEMTMLCSEILPHLEKRFRVHIHSHLLPGSCDVPPRVVWETRLHGDMLESFPQIVYGDPIIARLVGGNLQVTGGQVPIRAPDEEERLKEKVRRAFGPDAFIPRLLAKQHAVDFMNKLTATGASILGPGPFMFRSYAALELVFEPNNLDTPFGFRVREPDGNYKQTDLAAVMTAWQRGDKMVPLLDGGWAGLPVHLKKFAPMLLDILAAKEVSAKLPASIAYDLKALACELDLPLAPTSGWGQRLASLATQEHASIAVQASLRDYQKQGVDWLWRLRKGQLGGLLADDMGLGKTLQSICVLKPKTLVVAPSSVLFNWQNEIARFRPELKVGIYAGPKRSLHENWDIYLCSYNILRLDIAAIAQIKWAVMVLDEAQVIKNTTSQAAQAAYQVPADFRLALSGTPVENRLEDL